MSSPLVSVLLPSKGRFDKLKRAIQSWQATGPGEFEMLVRLHSSDAGSACRAHELREICPVRFWLGRDKSPGERNTFLWNEMLPAATGQWLQFWSDDMVIKGDWVNALKVCRVSIAQPEIHQLNQSIYVDDATGPTPFVRRGSLDLHGIKQLDTVPDDFFNQRIRKGGLWKPDFLKGVMVYHDRQIDDTLTAAEY